MSAGLIQPCWHNIPVDPLTVTLGTLDGGSRRDGPVCVRIIPVEPCRHPLDEAEAPADPVVLFSRWMDDVVSAGLPEPTAMVLATVSPAGRPRARTVLLKDFGPDGFVFYTNRSSAKGRHMAANPYVCLVFPWHPIQRQVIIEGSVQALSTSESEPYFHSRPHGSQLGAWASQQSAVLASRAELEARYQEVEARWPEGTTVPVPEFWGGYRVLPDVMEFWAGRPSRLHDRLRYRREGLDWVLERLAP
ncbi:MAG: pyridoxamine 5-phosphate oxidase [Streptosporangiaceae bacterium]|nr:pyridoxamine 5-phosphate oxidase [Streptosporangiaceae bacterium]